MHDESYHSNVSRTLDMCERSHSSRLDTSQGAVTRMGARVKPPVQGRGVRQPLSN